MRARAWDSDSSSISSVIPCCFSSYPPTPRIYGPNPELLDKDRVLGISKADILDDELRAGLQKELPEGIPAIFFSSVSGENIPQLKDLLWNTLNRSAI